MSDMLAGSVLDSAPLQGDDFESLLPLLPGVVRGPDGRLRVKGGQPSKSALQISSASMSIPRPATSTWIARPEHRVGRGARESLSRPNTAASRRA